MTPPISHIAVLHDRCTSTPERMDAYGIARRGRFIAVASALGKPSGLRALVREVLALADSSRSHAEAFRRGSDRVQRWIAGTDSNNVAPLVASFDEDQLSIFAAPEVRCFRQRGANIDVIESRCDVISGDAYLFCTVGVFATLSDETIRAALRDHYHPRDVASALVEEGRRAHARSELTAIVVRPVTASSFAQSA